MHTRVDRLVHPRGTTGIFGVFEVAVFDAAIFPAIAFAGSSFRTGERVVRHLAEQPNVGWIAAILPVEAFDAALVVPSQALLDVFRAPGGWRWHTTAYPDLSWVFGVADGLVAAQRPGLDLLGGSFRPPARPMPWPVDQFADAGWIVPALPGVFDAALWPAIWGITGEWIGARWRVAESLRLLDTPPDLAWIGPLVPEEAVEAAGRHRRMAPIIQRRRRQANMIWWLAWLLGGFHAGG